MTLSPPVAPLPVDSVDEAVAVLRARGLRVSSARRLVLEVLFAAEAPVTAEAIAAGLGGRLPPLDPASVYRNLEAFEELGLVRHVHLGHGPGLYALAAAEERGYAVCESCGAVEALDAGALVVVRDAVRASSGYAAGFAHFPIVGLCPDCQRPRSARGATES